MKYVHLITYIRVKKYSKEDSGERAEMYVLYEHFRHSHLVINLDKKYIKIQHAEGEICVNSRILQRHHAMMLFKCK